MSQQSQADGLQQATIQDDAEILREIESVMAKLKGGEMSDDAADSAIDRFHLNLEANDKRRERAAKLSLLRTKAETLSAAAIQPEYSHPIAETPAGSQETLSADVGLDRQVVADNSTLSGDMAEDGLGRMLLNSLIRPEKYGGGRQTLSDKGWDHLTKKRRIKASHAEFFAPGRGELLALSPYVDSAGGYVTSEQILSEIVAIRDRATGLESLCRTIDFAGPRVSFMGSKLKITFTKRGKGKAAEDEEIDLTDVISKTSLTAHPKDALLLIPEEFFEEVAFDIVAEIVRAAERDSRELNETEILTGTGNSEGLGIVPSVQDIYDAGATHIGIEPVGGAADWTEDEIKVFDTNLHAGAMSLATWVINRIVLRQFRLFRDGSGGAGTGNYLFEQNDKAGEMATFLQRPVVTSEFLPDTTTSGSEGDVLFLLLDLNDYWILRQKTLRLRILGELFAKEHQVGYQWVQSRDSAFSRMDAVIFGRRGA